jgi:hypothetical protein
MEVRATKGKPKTKREPTKAEWKKGEQEERAKKGKDEQSGGCGKGQL